MEELGFELGQSDSRARADNYAQYCTLFAFPPWRYYKVVPGYFEGSILEKFARQHYLVEKVTPGWEEAAKADSGNAGRSLVLC